MDQPSLALSEEVLDRERRSFQRADLLGLVRLVDAVWIGVIVHFSLAFLVSVLVRMFMARGSWPPADEWQPGPENLLLFTIFAVLTQAIRVNREITMRDVRAAVPPQPCRP